MKIAILVSGFPPHRIGGLELATHNIAKHLAKLGHDIHVITLWSDKPYVKNEDGFHVHRIMSDRFPFNLVPNKPIVAHAFYSMKIFWLVRGIKPDLLQAQSIDYSLPLYIIRNSLKIPCLVYGRGSDVYLPRRMFKSLYPYLLPRLDAVIALTEDMRRFIRKFSNRDIDVIPNGIDLNGYKPPPRGEIRNRLGIRRDETVLLYVGGLRPVKGVGYLIEAVDILRRSGMDIRLIVVGDGRERGKLEMKTEIMGLWGVVTFAGQVFNNSIPDYMSAADMLVLPSLSEGFPNVILEAIAIGLPIVATRVGGVPEIMADGVNGLLANPQDSHDLAEKIKRLLGDKELCGKIAKGNGGISAQYSWESTAEQLESVYRRVLDSRCSGGNV